MKRYFFGPSYSVGHITRSQDIQMHAAFIARDQAAESIPIWFVSRSNWQTLRQSLDQQALAYADSLKSMVFGWRRKPPVVTAR